MMMLFQRSVVSKFFACAVLVTLCAACGPTESMRNGLTLVIDRSNAQKQELADFTKAANARRDEQEAFLREIEDQTIELRRFVEETEFEWGLAGGKDAKEALAVLKKLRERDADIRKNPLGSLAPQSEVLGEPGKTFEMLKVDISQYDTIIRNYSKMKEERSATDLAGFYIDFAQDIAAEQKKLEKSKTDKDKIDKEAADAKKNLPK